MNIYFACSITGGRDHQSIYKAITDFLLSSGHIVPTAHLADHDVVDLEKIVEADDVFRRDVDWIKECDVLVAEISTPSHGVGYEIGYALNLNKPVLCLHKEGIKVSKMITGNPDQLLHVASYKDKNEAITFLRDFLNK